MSRIAHRLLHAAFVALALVGPSAVAPAQAADAYTVMSRDRRFRTWMRLIDSAELRGYAQGRRPYTLFAPVEDSMSNIDPELMRAIEPRASYGGADLSQTIFVVQSHVVLGKLSMEGLAGKVTTLKSITGKDITVDATKMPAVVTFVGSTGTLQGAPIVTDNAIIYPVLLTSAKYVPQ